MLIVHIIKEIVNTLWRNAKQVRKIENSLSSFENKVRRQNLKINLSNLPLELSYHSIKKFWNVFEDEASTERLNICKNVDEYENMVRYFYARLTLFV